MKGNPIVNLIFYSGMVDDDVDISDMLHTTNNIDNNFLNPPPGIKRPCRALSLHLQLYRQYEVPCFVYPCSALLIHLCRSTEPVSREHEILLPLSIMGV